MREKVIVCDKGCVLADNFEHTAKRLLRAHAFVNPCKLRNCRQTWTWSLVLLGVMRAFVLDDSNPTAAKLERNA